MKLFKKNAAPLLHLAGLDVNLVKVGISFIDKTSLRLLNSL